MPHFYRMFCIEFHCYGKDLESESADGNRTVTERKLFQGRSFLARGTRAETRGEAAQPRIREVGQTKKHATTSTSIHVHKSIHH